VDFIKKYQKVDIEKNIEKCLKMLVVSVRRYKKIRSGREK